MNKTSGANSKQKGVKQSAYDSRPKSTKDQDYFSAKFPSGNGLNQDDDDNFFDLENDHVTPAQDKVTAAQSAMSSVNNSTIMNESVRNYFIILICRAFPRQSKISLTRPRSCH